MQLFPRLLAHPTLGPTLRAMLFSAVGMILFGGLLWWGANAYVRNDKEARRARMAQAWEESVATSQVPSPAEMTAASSNLLALPKIEKQAVEKPIRQAANSARLGEEQILLRTVAGDLLLGLYPEVAPQTVEHLLKLTRLGAFDTTHFGRLERGFVLQVHTAQERQLPLGDELRQALRPIRGEFSPIPHDRGILSMARADGQPDSAVSSFSILLGRAPHLDQKYAVFGEVLAGLEVLDRLEKMPLRDRKHPTTRLTILAAEVLSAEQAATVILEPALSEFQIATGVPPTWLPQEAAKVLQTKCVQCHGAENGATGLNVTSRGGLLRSSARGKVVQLGHAATSSLWQYSHLPLSGEDFLEGESHPGMLLTPAEQATLFNWIAFGLPEAATAATAEPLP